jgi:thiol-disulfide isomerase/thioredoxin
MPPKSAKSPAATTDTTTRCILLGVLVFSLALVLYVSYTRMTSQEKFSQDGNVRVCLFHATWCPHCTKYLDSGTFDNAYSKAREANGNVTFEKIDYDQNKNLANKYDINSFPTIIAIDAQGNQIEKFQGNRHNIEEVVDFALKAAA